MNFGDLAVETDGELYFKNSDNQNICYQSWKLAGVDITKAVFIQHGVGEHYRAYDKVIEGLLKKNFLVCAHDHVGHGKSDGDRVHVDSFTRYVDDAVQHINIVKEKYPNIICYILGHSMGGAVTLKTVLDHPALFSGVALIDPAIEPNPDSAGACKTFLLKPVALLFPQMEVSTIDTSLLCRDKQVVQQYIDDPLNWHGGLKARWSACLLDTMSEIKNRTSEVTWPVLFIHGSADQICMPSGSQYVYDRAPSKNKHLKIFPGAYHQVHKEIDGDSQQCINDISEFFAGL